MIAIAVLAIWGYALAIQKDNWMSNIVVNSVPLVGLLGTVLGMMQTFSALSQGGASSIENLSKGISKALITTQTGISIAVSLFSDWLSLSKKKLSDDETSRLVYAGWEMFLSKTFLNHLLPCCLTGYGDYLICIFVKRYRLTTS